MWPPSEKDWRSIPEHICGGIRHYVEHGVKPGDFLEAVICNKLQEAFERADEVNIHNMFYIVKFFYNCVPRMARGSAGLMKEWMEKGGLKGKINKAIDDLDKL